MSKPHIGMVIPQNTGVGYYRFHIPAQELRKLGYTVSTIHDLTEEKLSRWLLHTKPDIVHTGYVTDVEGIQPLVAVRNFRHTPFITDIDDDIINVPSYNVAFSSYHQAAQPRKVARMHLRVSDHVTVSTAPLLNVLSTEARALTHLPNCCNPDHWRDLPRDPRRSDDTHIRFLFSGNRGRYGDVVEVGEAFTWAMEKFPQLRLFFIGLVPDWAAPYMTDKRDPAANRAFAVPYNSIDVYPSILSYISPDVIFAPVQCNKFNESKSHIKAYDAVMTGAAFLCTDWPTYDPVPQDCCVKVSNTTTQWKESIEALITDSSLRSRLAARLVTWALDTYAIDRHVDKWVHLYEEVLSKPAINDYESIVHPAR